MHQIGVLNQTYSEEEIEELSAKFLGGLDCKILRLDIKNLTQELSDIDVVFMLSDSSTFSMSTTCSTIIKIREITNAYIVIYQKETDMVNRLVYLQLGANLNIGEESQAKEVQLIIQNEMKYRADKSSGLIEFERRTPTFYKDSPMVNRLEPISELERKVNLTRIEYKLLSLLQSDIGKPFTHQEIYQSVWKKAYNDQKPRVANVVFRLREKLDRNGYPADKYIQTAHGIGYKMHLD
ncbi:winged helix-turn-helix domain-containing protein [Enterococcus sp. AZ192]|uniref:winged helix-turn-helix domain-containing protein n=1 Tax=unclassified Enterococcus TaxID=2608891 RepID=UPI003D290329